MPPTGFIKIQAVTSRAEIPVEDAAVTISAVDANGKRILLSMQLTDENGMTDPVSVTTPVVENSLSPDQNQGWTDVTVRISHPGYEGIIVNQVQIFPGITTIQELILIPKELSPMPGEPDEQITVPPQGL